MPISSQKLIEQLRGHTGLNDEDDLTTENALLYLNQAFWELLNKIKFKEKERTIPFSTQAGIRKYRVPILLESIQAVVFVDPDTGQHTPIERGGTWQYDNDYNESEDQRAVPTKYFRDENFIVLWPTPDLTYTIELRYFINLNDLENDANAPNVPQEWNEVILYGGVSRAFIGAGDWNRATKARDFQSSVANNLDTTGMKEQVDSHTSHFEVLGYDGPQV